MNELQLPEDKRHFLRRMVDGIVTKFIKGHREHGTPLRKIANILEAKGEAQDLLTYIQGWEEACEYAISLLDSCQYGELRELLVAQLGLPKPNLGAADPNFVHVLEQVGIEE